MLHITTGGLSAYHIIDDPSLCRVYAELSCHPRIEEKKNRNVPHKPQPPTEYCIYEIG